MWFTQYDKENKVATAASHIEEQEDGTFKLIWTRFIPKEYRTGCKVKLDVVRPGRRYTDIQLHGSLSCQSLTSTHSMLSLHSSN